MKQWIVYGLTLAVLLFPSKQGTELGKLRPVELFYAYREGETLVLRTDTGDLGAGRNLRQAVSDLKRTSQGAVFLDSADYLIVTEETEALIPEFINKMRPSAEVCRTADDVDPEKAAEFLSSHPGNVTLQDLRAGERKLPQLRAGKGRYHLDQ